MKTNFTLIVLSILLSSSNVLHAQTGNANSLSSSTNKLPENVPADWYANAAEQVKEVEYDFFAGKDQNSFRVANSANRTGFLIKPGGYNVHTIQYGQNQSAWSIDFAVAGIGRGNQTKPFPANVEIVKGRKTVSYISSVADIQYINSQAGLRQNFIIRQRPDGEGVFSIKMQWRSELEASLLLNNQLVFHTAGQAKDIQFIYEDLKVWDATNRSLPARMEIDKSTNCISLIVDDRNAVYPVTVDPLNKTPEWTTTANGVLPGLLNNLQLQVQTLYGHTVAGLGDINGDGFDDVAVSAPTMADVISGTGSLTSVGAVFVYLGSATGLSATPSKVLQPTTAVNGALFGYSIDAGDITGDGKNDIIIGAPLDSYQTTAQGLLGDVSVNVTAGKVYLYKSEDLLSSSNPSSFVQIRLQGSDFFSTGVLGLLNNITAKPLFGYSVAVTEDMNADGKADIVIGVPNYLGTQLLSVQSGAAFVYYSNNLATTSPDQLQVPSPALLGLPLLPLANTAGLLFGFSVDGVGDYNGDNKPDIIVGAPAGVDLSSLGGLFTGQVLGGSAYIYYGNGSGVNTNIGVRIQAKPSGLLSNAANLFGYKVKGVRNASAARNGNILVGAPAGSVLSNVLGGLQVKAGEVHVFVKKGFSPVNDTATSDQTISSSRSSSILSILSGKTINVSLLFGSSMDNMLDINCDGIGDIIVGEPLSTAVPLIGADVVGGAAYVYLGQANGTYVSTPHWSLYSEVTPLLGVNATALLGYSVAGARNVQGHGAGSRGLVGGPTNSLDFGAGLLKLGNTLAVTFDFAFDNNGLGKAYSFAFACPSLLTLPAELLTFDRQIKGKTVLLDWVTVNEDNFSHFELQRSANGINFETIAFVLAKGAQRNDYQYTDMTPFFGTNYYRLRMIDNNGQFKYSQVRTAKFDAKSTGEILAMPNPAVNNEIRLRLSGLSEGSYQATLHNAAGQLLMTKAIIINQQNQLETMIPAVPMTAGVYCVSLLDKNKQPVQTLRVLVSK